MQQSSNTTQRRKAATKPIQSAPPTPNTLALGVATVKRNKWGTSPFDEHWLNFDCCGLICAFVTWSLHIYAVYAVDFILLPPWMSTTGEIGRSLSFWGHFHRVAYTITAGLACIAHFYAMTTDPGAVPPDANPLPAPEEEKIVVDEAAEDQILVAPTQTGRRLCRRCRSFKPQRAHHCSVCRRCIVKMDHHCPWVNNCVGIGNHKYFLLFVFYTFISCLYSMSLVVFRFVVCMHRVPGARIGLKHMHCLDQPSHLLYILGLVVEAVLFGLFTSCMMVDQWDVVMSNVTHIDRLKGETGGDKVAGVTEVFGAPRIGRSTGFRCDWLSPVSKACFPPSIKDEILGYCRPCNDTEKEPDGVELGISGRMVRSVAEIV